MNRFSEEEISQQEALTPERLKKISVGYHADRSTRPSDSLVELMDWAKRFIIDSTCGEETKSDPYPVSPLKNLESLVHNKISMDGSFMKFCEDNGAEIQGIHTDAITSWKSESADHEHFVAVGIFEITKGDLKFYHCGLFHKGNQNEDEVSFFIIAEQDQLQGYLEFRNEFDAWTKVRDREALEIEVIGGNAIPYEEEADWDDLFMPDELKKQIIQTFDGFFASEEIYKKLKVPWRIGMGFWGPRGCHAKDERVLMYDGTTKAAQDVKVGDSLIGPDSRPREVLELVSGKDEMFEITPSKSKPFIVNGEHILHLKTSNELKSIPKTINVTVNDYLKLSKSVRDSSWYVLSKPSIVSFPKNNGKELFEPYFIGLWLGDGTSSGTGVTVSDSDEVTINFLSSIAKKYNLHISISRKNGANCATYKIATDVGKSNILKQTLNNIGILNNKHIPKDYLTSSIDNRLEVLAGLIDSDGHYHVADLKKPSKGYFEILQKRKQLSDDIVFLSRSLGFRATIKEVTKSCEDFSGKYFRINISGDVERIPVRLDRKKSHVGNPNKSHLSYGIKSIKSLGINNYYGFIVNQDHLYLDDDFFIQHNCGKTSCLRMLMAKYPQLKPITVQPGHGSPNEILEQAFEYAANHAPALVFFEDVQEWIRTVDMTHFLQLLSGVNKVDGIITVITGNDFSDLEDNVKSRPGRFDKFFKFPLPDKELTKKYLTKSFGDILTPRKIASIASKTVKNSLTYSHLESLYFTAVSISIPDGRETPTEKDVDEALKQVISSKEFADDDFKSRQRSLADDYGEEYEDEDESEEYGSEDPESTVL